MSTPPRNRDDLGQLDEKWQHKLRERPIKADDCYFYHWVDMPDGTVIPGDWDLRQNWSAYLGHVDFANRRVLEFGSASGFLSLKMESLGADVVGFDLPRGAACDLLPVAGADPTGMASASATEHDRLQNSWWYVHQRFNSKTKAVYGNIYDLPPDLGRFDVSVFASILLHLSNPFAALQQAARITDSAIIITDMSPLYVKLLPIGLEHSALMEFAPEHAGHVDNMVWWDFLPNTCVRMLRLLGFSDIKVCHHEHMYYYSRNSKPLIGHFYTLVATRPGASLSYRNDSKLDRLPDAGLTELISVILEKLEDRERLARLVRSRSGLLKLFFTVAWKRLLGQPVDPSV